MNLPKGAELLGTNATELEIKGAGARTIVPLSAAGQRQLAALPATFGEELPVRVYLVLEHIRGTRDAAVLSAYLNLPPDGHPDQHHPRRAGVMGLYGLRMASIPYGANMGAGLTFQFDVTQILVELRAAGLLDPAEIHVSIDPDRALPDPSGLVVGQVGIFSLVLG